MVSLSSLFICIAWMILFCSVGRHWSRSTANLPINRGFDRNGRCSSRHWMRQCSSLTSNKLASAWGSKRTLSAGPLRRWPGQTAVDLWSNRRARSWPQRNLLCISLWWKAVELLSDFGTRAKASASHDSSSIFLVSLLSSACSANVADRMDAGHDVHAPLRSPAEFMNPSHFDAFTPRLTLNGMATALIRVRECDEHHQGGRAVGRLPNRLECGQWGLAAELGLLELASAWWEGVRL